jgi:hypothetical protein
MTRHLFSAFALILMISASGCGPKKPGDEVSSRCQPSDVRVDVNSGTMDVYWKSNCDQLISGYNIYINEEPIVEKYPGATLPESVTPFNGEPYAGDTNPDDDIEHFTAERLENGKKYFVSVRIVNPDRTVSKPSNEVVAVCGPTGEIELSIRYKSSQDGFSFERNEYVAADAIENDLYFFSNGDGDYLSFLKENLLGKLALKGSYNDVRHRLCEISSKPGEQRIAVRKGDWLHIATPDDTNAVLKVLDISGAGSDRKIRLFFAYNPLPGELIF